MSELWKDSRAGEVLGDPSLAVPFELRPKLLDPTGQLPGSALFQAVHDLLHGPALNRTRIDSGPVNTR